MNTPQNTEKKKTTVKILSLDGGGIRGIISAVILKEVENQLEKYCEEKNLPEIGLHDYFDLVAGTSTGSLIAAGIAVKKEADDLITLYEKKWRRHLPKTNAKTT